MSHKFSINQKLCNAQPYDPVQKLKANIPVGSDQFGFQVSLIGDQLAITTWLQCQYRCSLNL